MRRSLVWLLCGGVVLLAGGCPTDPFWPGNEGVLGSVVSDGFTDLAAGDHQSAPASAVTYDARTITGSVTGQGNYRLYDLGPVAVGDRFAVTRQGLSLVPSTFAVVLFDENYDLVAREVLVTGGRLEHVARDNSAAAYLGVSPSTSSDGGDFQFVVSRAGADVPPPRPQVVWLNFSSASDLRVHRRTGLAFAPFDAATLGDEYAGYTQVMKDTIVAEMREDYADYNVVIISSDESPPPEGEYSTIHFGGADAGLLGLADSVDGYNSDATENAIVFMESFAPFAVMQLDAEEMGLMIANVGSHELGHLLGLYHTRVPTDIMDTTGTAWDLAGEQAFSRAELEARVFPYGYEDSPRLLEQTVGLAENPKESSQRMRTYSSEKLRRRALVRELAAGEMRSRCGNCLNPDDN